MRVRQRGAQAHIAGVHCMLGEVDKAEANAALIVNAVNAHDALVEAVETAVKVLDQGSPIDCEQSGYLRMRYDAALALARGDPP